MVHCVFPLPPHPPAFSTNDTTMFPKIPRLLDRNYYFSCHNFKMLDLRIYEICILWLRDSYIVIGRKLFNTITRLGNGSLVILLDDLFLVIVRYRSCSRSHKQLKTFNWLFSSLPFFSSSDYKRVRQHLLELMLTRSFYLPSPSVNVEQPQPRISRWQTVCWELHEIIRFLSR